MAGPLFDILNNITNGKQPIINEDNEKDYNPYMINRFLSGSMDCVLYANEMNQRHFLDKKIQFDYLFHSIRKTKRFSKFLKAETSEDLELVKTYYNYNNERAREALKILTTEDLDQIRESLSTGGLKQTSKSKKK